MDIAGIFAEHWLSIGAAIFLAGMVLYGHYRGFLRIAVTMSALVISIVFVRATAPYMTSYLKENTQIRSMIQQTLVKAAGGAYLSEEGEETPVPDRQAGIIEELHLPKQMKEALLENNNSSIYEILGVHTFAEYIGSYLSDMILNLIGSLLLFLIVYIVLRLLMHVLDLVARLPILYGMNQIAGAFIGLIRGLIWIWAAFLFADLFSSSPLSAAVQEQIQKSIWLSFLYHHNLLNWIFISILKSFI